MNLEENIRLTSARLERAQLLSYSLEEECKRWKQVRGNFFNLMASGGLYSSIYIKIHSPYNHLCALDITLRVLNT